MTPEINKRRRSASGLPGLAAALILTLPIAAAAQTTVIGQADNGSVSVDYSVLNELGSPPTIPDLVEPSVRSLLMPNADMPRTGMAQPRLPGVQGRIELTPPGERRPAPRRSAATGPAPRPATRPATAPATRIAPAPEPPSAQPPAPAAPPPPPAIADRPAESAPPRQAEMPPPPAPPSAPETTARATPPPAPPAPPPAPPQPTERAQPATPPPPEPQSAALPPADERLSPGQQFRLSFGAGSVELDKGSEERLNRIAQSLGADEGLRLQLLAYAGGGGQTASQARRLSLSRALAVRSYLIKEGIVSTRIDVRALGNKFEGGPPDRVDVIVTTR